MDTALEELQVLAHQPGANPRLLGAMSRLVQQAADRTAAARIVGAWLRAQGRPREAEEWLRRALVTNPECAQTRAELAATFMDRGRLEEACVELSASLQRDPSLVMAHCNFATCLYQLRRLPEALHHYRQASDAAPQFLYPVVQALSVARQLCDWRDWDSQIERLQTVSPAPGNDASQLDLLFLPLSAQQLRAHAEAHATGTRVAQLEGDFGVALRSHRPSPLIRIGYLSDDLRDHVVGSLLAEVLELHDRRRFEIHAFDWKPATNTIIERRMRRAGVQVHDLRGLSDEQAASRIAGIGIDILVDLKGYTTDHRIGILRRRAAPIQIAWLGYPGTLGDPCVDYIIADPVVIPASLESAYTEKVLRLPTVFFPHDRNRPVGRRSVRAMYGIPDESLVFCHLGRSSKVTPEVFDDWIHILNGVPNSVLWLRADGAAARTNLAREAQSRGLAADRLVFVGDEHARTSDFVARYLLADIALDTFPYGSHVTAIEALWAGCPLVTRTGSTFASRVAASLLQVAGLAELVASSREGYRRICIALGRDRGRTANLRNFLEESRTCNPLFDTPRLVRELELGYRMAFERISLGQPLASIDVPPLQLSVSGGGGGPAALRR